MRDAEIQRNNLLVDFEDRQRMREDGAGVFNLARRDES